MKQVVAMLVDETSTHNEVGWEHVKKMWVE